MFHVGQKPALSGKVAIVTGAGNGIGRAEAMYLASLGASVVVNDCGGNLDGEAHDNAPADAVVAEIVAGGGRAVANYNDVGDWTGAHALIEHAVASFGKLDILVNNAGIIRDAPIIEMTEDQWDSVVRVHLKGTFNCMRHAGAYWKAEAERGRPTAAAIVNTTSRSGLPGPGVANYGAAKAGIATLTVTAAFEMRNFGVRVNAICPFAYTRTVARAVGRSIAPDATDRPLDPAFLASNNAPLVAWLASDAAMHVTGQIFRVKGGEITHYEPWKPGRRVTSEKPWTVEALNVAVNGQIFGSYAAPLEVDMEMLKLRESAIIREAR